MNEAVQGVLVNVVLSLISLLGAYAMYYISRMIQKVKEETAKLKDEKQQQIIDRALEQLNDLTTKTVASIEQTTAKDLREAIKKGNASKEELTRLSTDAFISICRKMKPEYLQALERTMIDFEKYIEDTIEAEVLRLKGVR
jgi:Na+-transporting methylmalonyl-CoA/oxaloacetate decarboxylase gamma subunit